MKQAKYDIGTLIKVNDTELNHKTIVGFVCGVKLTQRQDAKTRENQDIFAYLISGHTNDWYYEDHIAKVSK